MNRRLFAALLSAALVVPAFAAELPRPAPEYAVNLPGGKTIKISDYKGKIVVVEFLLVTCPHCQNAARILSRYQKEYGPKGVQVIGISIEPSANVVDFHKQYASEAYPIGVAQTRESVYAFLQHSLMSPTFYVPQILIIDRKGVIQEQHGGSDPYLQNEEANLKISIEKALAAGPAKKASAPRKKSKTS